jgi:hypothetical protein
MQFIHNKYTLLQKVYKLQTINSDATTNARKPTIADGALPKGFGRSINHVGEPKEREK